MKIGITCYPTYGGSGVVATELGLELAQRGHEIHFISYAQPIRLRGAEPNIHYHEVEVSRYPLFDYPPYDLALATRMAEVAQLYDLDLLHVHYAIPHSVSAMLARQMLGGGPAQPATAVRHYPARHRHHAGRPGPLLFADHSLFDRAERRRNGNFQLSARAHATDFRCEETDRGDLQLCQLRRLLCAIPRSPRRCAASTRPTDQNVLVHLSNFRPVKRLSDVIEIFDRVHKQIPSRLLLIGDGPDRSVAEWLAVQKGIHDDVLFLGKQDQIYEKLSIADIMLLPSELESFGLAALEAMACEVVPISTQGRRRSGSDRSRQRPDISPTLATSTRWRAMRSSCSAMKSVCARWEDGARRSRWNVSARPRLWSSTKTSTVGCWSARRRNLPGLQLVASIRGSRMRISVPFPSWLSIVMRAVSP